MTKIVDTFADFVTAAADVADFAKGTQRVGQRAFNLLAQVKPDVSSLLAGSDFDPFYDDARLPLFYDFVMRHWDDDKVGL